MQFHPPPCNFKVFCCTASVKLINCYTESNSFDFMQHCFNHFYCIAQKKFLRLPSNFTCACSILSLDAHEKIASRSQGLTGNLKGFSSKKFFKWKQIKYLTNYFHPYFFNQVKCKLMNCEYYYYYYDHHHHHFIFS